MALVKGTNSGIFEKLEKLKVSEYIVSLYYVLSFFILFIVCIAYWALNVLWSEEIYVKAYSNQIFT